MTMRGLITFLSLLAARVVASPTQPLGIVAAALSGDPDGSNDSGYGDGDGDSTAYNGTLAKRGCRRGHGCDGGRCWRSCNEDEGTWCWMADVHTFAWLSCSSDDTCLNAIRHGTAACHMSVCSDCGCGCW
ncbi:OPT oligopeptide transporter [Purpureocillium lavendulum]|uniref:OPT oligopeptide transporter n=1 Tax=Purpureocillium lavendulum TaxID=1247861 RepID=A0AB34FK65_9HYPO|nr:OPT oligopeptide transporter [Purpureocillium lavendulum]